jgi:hypothetical protein
MTNEEIFSNFCDKIKAYPKKDMNDWTVNIDHLSIRCTSFNELLEKILNYKKEQSQRIIGIFMGIGCEGTRYKMLEAKVKEELLCIENTIISLKNWEPNLI